MGCDARPGLAFALRACAAAVALALGFARDADADAAAPPPAPPPPPTLASASEPAAAGQAASAAKDASAVSTPQGSEAASGGSEAVPGTTGGPQTAASAPPRSRFGFERPLMGDIAPTLAPADARVDVNRELGLMDAWKAALVNAPRLRAATANLSAEEEQLVQARGMWLPMVALSMNRTQNNLSRSSIDQPSNSTYDSYLSRNDVLSLRQPLFRKALDAQVKQSERTIEQARADLERERQTLLITLAQAYFEALLARDTLDYLKSQRVFLISLVNASRMALDAGTGTRTDVDEALSRLDLNRAQLLEARQQIDFTRRQLGTLINAPFGMLARLDPKAMPTDLPDPPDVEGWVKKAFALSPEIASLKAQRDAAVQEVEKARAGHLPTLDLVMQHQNSRSESTITPQLMFTNRTLGLVLNVPIYSGGQVNSATRQAAAQVERLDELLAALRQDLSVRVHKEFRGYTDGLSKVQALQTALRSAEVALDSARKSLEAGVRTTVDVLNAEQQRQQVLRDLAQARYETLLSLVRMESLTGNVDHGVLAKLDAALIR